MSIVKWELISTDAEYSWRKNTGSSTLQLGTTSTTALAGNTPTITSTQAALITTNQSGVATNLSATESNNNNIVANRNTGIMNTRFRDKNTPVIASHTSTLSNYGSSIIANSNSITNLTNSDETNTSAIATIKSDMNINFNNIDINFTQIATNAANLTTVNGNVNENTGDIISANANISQLISAISTNTSGRITNASNITANLSAINNLAGTYIIFRADTTEAIYTDSNFQFRWDAVNKQLMFQMLTAPGIGAWIDGGMSITGTGVHLGVGDDLTSELNSDRYFTGTNVTTANLSFSAPTYGTRMNYFLCPEGNWPTYPTYEMTIFLGTNTQTTARLLVRRYPS